MKSIVTHIFITHIFIVMAVYVHLGGWLLEGMLSDRSDIIAAMMMML